MGWYRSIPFGLRSMIAGIALVLLAVCVPIQLRAQEPASDLSWFEGSWLVFYEDARLGIVRGAAKVILEDQSSKADSPIETKGYVHVRAPGDDRVYKSSITSITSRPGSLEILLDGESPPSGARLSPDDIEELQDAVAEGRRVPLTPGMTLRASIEDAEALAEAGDQNISPAPQPLKLVIGLSNGDDYEVLQGEWSYEMQSPEGMDERRAGEWRFDDHIVSGKEAWARAPIQIDRVVDVDLPDSTDLKRRQKNSAARKAFLESLGPEFQDEAYALVWLRIEGHDLPVEPKRKIEVIFKSEGIVWTGQHRIAKDDQESLEIQVVLKNGIRPGLKEFTLNDTLANWNFETEPVSVRHIRPIAEDEKGAVTEWEESGEFYLGDVFQIEAQYSDIPDFDEEIFELEVSGESGSQTHAIKLQKTDGGVLRSAPILIVEQSSNPAASPDDDIWTKRFVNVVHANHGDRFVTNSAQASSIAKRKSLAISVVLVGPPTIWERAMLRARRCWNAGNVEKDVSNFIAVEMSTRSTRISRQDHAAAILLRDELLHVLRNFTRGEDDAINFRDQNLPKEEQLKRLKEFDDYTEGMIYAARYTWSNDPTFAELVRLPKGVQDLDVFQIGDVTFARPKEEGADKARLDVALGFKIEAEAFQGSRSSFFMYARGAVWELRQQRRSRALNAARLARQIDDCDTIGLLKLLREGVRQEGQQVVLSTFVRSALKKLLKHSKSPAPIYPRWIPDLYARAQVKGVATLAAAIQAQEEYAALDTDLAIAVLTLPFAVSSVSIAAVRAAGAGATTIKAAPGLIARARGAPIAVRNAIYGNSVVQRVVLGGMTTLFGADLYQIGRDYLTLRDAKYERKIAEGLLGVDGYARLRKAQENE